MNQIIEVWDALSRKYRKAKIIGLTNNVGIKIHWIGYSNDWNENINENEYKFRIKKASLSLNNMDKRTINKNKRAPVHILRCYCGQILHNDCIRKELNLFWCYQCFDLHETDELFEWSNCHHKYSKKCAIKHIYKTNALNCKCGSTLTRNDNKALGFNKFLCFSCNEFHDFDDIFEWSKCNHEYSRNCALRRIETSKTLHCKCGSVLYYHDNTLLGFNKFLCILCNEFHDFKDLFQWSKCYHSYSKNCALSYIMLNKALTCLCGSKLSDYDNKRIGLNSFMCCYCNQFHDMNKLFEWPSCKHKYCKCAVQKILDDAIPKKFEFFSSGKPPRCSYNNCQNILKYQTVLDHEFTLSKHQIQFLRNYDDKGCNIM